MNSELINLLKHMDIPYNRKQDIHWLLKNLSTKNKFKRGFKRAMEILKEESNKTITSPLNFIP